MYTFAYIYNIYLYTFVNHFINGYKYNYIYIYINI